MRVAFDIEANGLENPTEIWLIVCKDIDTGEFHIFRGREDYERFKSFARGVKLWIGHNVLGYDIPVLVSLLGIERDRYFPVCNICDTLIISKLVDYSREAHSIEQYGKEFGSPKGDFKDFSKYSLEMEEYCVRDVEICERIYRTYLKYISNPDYRDAIVTEHEFQLIVNALHDNGFAFDCPRATRLLGRVETELASLDTEILKEFPPKLQLDREITPRITKHGTLNKGDFRWVSDGDLSTYNGGPFCLCQYVTFNPSSHKQIIDVLNKAGWRPTEKTKTHIDVERDLHRSRWSKEHVSETQIQEWKDKLIHLKTHGWKVSEQNLSTLPISAPKPARTLAKRIMLESRRRTLVEWIGCCKDGRIHGQFYAIGSWPHRMAHQKPNTANIPTDIKLYGKEMRQLWVSPKGRLLVGVDAESIQLRIFAHLIDDAEFTYSLVSGKKEDGTDPHSMNQKIIGEPCRKGRKGAKNFIYAYFLGGGVSKLSFLLGCSDEEGREAIRKMEVRYPGLVYLREKIIPADAKRGWFIALDGRPIKIEGDSIGNRKHKALAGYLQSGETIVMRKAAIKFNPKLKEFDSFLVDFVHDEWQTECPNDFNIALQVAKIQADAIREVGEELKLKCPLAGSYWNDDHKDYTIGTNWYQTH